MRGGIGAFGIGFGRCVRPIRIPAPCPNTKASTTRGRRVIKLGCGDRLLSFLRPTESETYSLHDALHLPEVCLCGSLRPSSVSYNCGSRCPKQSTCPASCCKYPTISCTCSAHVFYVTSPVCRCCCIGSGSIDNQSSSCRTLEATHKSGPSHPYCLYLLRESDLDMAVHRCGPSYPRGGHCGPGP